MNVKSVKDYEQEIEQLRAENFELKTRLTHAPGGDNIPKILYEQSEQFTRLEQAREELARQNEELRQALNRLSQEKLELEKGYNNGLLANSERMGLLEDENKRLLLRLERSNKEISEAEQLKGLLRESERLNNEYKSYIQNAECKWEQERFEHKREIESLQSRTSEIRAAYERQISDKASEVMNLRKVLDAEINRNKSNSLIITDLKTTLSNELRNKENLNKELERMKELGHKASEMEEYIQNQKREGQVYLAGMEKLKKIVTEKLLSILKKLDLLSEMVQDLSKTSTLSPENQRFLQKLKVTPGPINNVVMGFRTILKEAYSKIDVLKREAKDATFFAESNRRQQTTKVVRVLEEFKVQFSAAKSELLECRKYLEKKALENKELRSENARLKKDIAAVNFTKRPTSVSLGSKNPLRL